MALSVQDKNVVIAAMERTIADAKEAAGVTTLAEVETGVSALRTAFDTDPATVTAAQLNTAKGKIDGLVFPRTDSLTSVFTEIKTEATAA